MTIKSAFEVSSGVLHIHGSPVSAPYPVAQLIVAGDVAIVRLEVHVGAIFNRNVLAYASDTQLIWSIPESPYGGTFDKMYVCIEPHDDAMILARDWNGIEYLVACATGHLVVSGFRRF